MSALVWTTETPAQPPRGPRYCEHGKDEGRPCYPCDMDDGGHAMPVPVETPYGPREAVADWLRANDIDPNDVPIDGPIAIEHGPLEGRSIRYAAMLRSDEGCILHDPETDGPKVKERTAPLQVEPPTNVQV